MFLPALVLVAGCAAIDASDGTPLLSQASASQVKRLSVRGRDILDPSGAAVVLRGWNWGISEAAQPDDAAANAGQGATIVRIPIRWWGDYDPGEDARLAAAEGHIDPVYLAKIDDKIDSLTNAEIWVDLFVDSNCGQGSFEHDKPMPCGLSDDRQSAANFGNSAAMRTEFLELWAFLAEHFSNHKRIGMYEILSEPNLGCAKEQTTCDYNAIPALYRPVIERIRAVDPATPVMVGATNTYDMENIASAYLDGVTGVIYTADILSNAAANMPQILQPALTFRRTKNVPIFIQQVGVKKSDTGAPQSLDSTLTELAARQIGWTWWTYREPKARDGNGYAPYYIGYDAEWHEDLPRLNQITGYF